MNKGDFLAIIIAASTYLMLFIGRGVKVRVRKLWVYWFVLTLHHIVAISASFFAFDLIVGDAAYFDSFARNISPLSEWPTINIGSDFYIAFLSIFYTVFGYSLFLACELSILAFSISCRIFSNFQHYLGLRRFESLALFLFGIVPATTYFGSIPLRESYEVLFFMVAIYYGLQYQQYRKTAHLLMLLFGAIFMGLFHKGLIIYSFFLIGVILIPQFIVMIRRQSLVTLLGLGGGLVFLIGVFMFLLSGDLNNRGSAVLKALTGGEIVEYTALRRDRFDEVASRASYDVRVDRSSTVGLLKSSVYTFVYYMSTPFIWQIANVMDLYVFFENFVRMVLIFYAVRFYWQLNDTNVYKKPVKKLLIYFIFMELMWSLGTLNYGTALRHHIIAWWVVVLLGVSNIGLSEKKNY